MVVTENQLEDQSVVEEMTLWGTVWITTAKDRKGRRTVSEGYLLRWKDTA